MPRFEDLHPDQRAVLQLVLGRGRDYADIAGVLRTDVARVRDRAQDAVDGLAPEDVDGLDLDDRERIADYLLSQQPPVEADATRALLASSAPARAWARTVAAQLEPLAERPLPSLETRTPDGPARPGGRRRAGAGRPVPSPAPAGAGRSTAGPAAAAPARGARGAAAPPGERQGSRTGALGLLAALVAVVVLVVLLATGVLGGSSDDGGQTTATPATSTPQSDGVAQQINFDPVGGSGARGVGFAQVVDETPVLLFAGEGFRPTTSSRFYAVWLEGGAQARRLGFLSRVASDGRVERLVIQLPQNVERWRRVVITEESEEDPQEPGRAIVRADLADVTAGGSAAAGSAAGGATTGTEGAGG